MKGVLQKVLSLLLVLTLTASIAPLALAEEAPSLDWPPESESDVPVSAEMYEIAMTPHLDGYHADPETMTDGEWAAQFACDEYEEDNAALQLGQLASSDINPIDFIKMISSMKSLPDLAQKGAFWLLAFLWQGLMQGDGEDAKFKAIMNKLNDIEKKLDELKRGHTIDVYEKYLNEQLKERTKLAVDIRLIMNDLDDVDFALNNYGGKQITKEEAAKRRKAIIMRWGTQKIAGLSNGLAATLYYINYTMQMRVRNRSYIGMLDDYVYICLPWEHLGYQARELLRSAEMSTMYAALALSSMYLSLTKQLDSKTGREITQLTTDVANWFETQPVTRDAKWTTCQIRGEQGSRFLRNPESFSEQLDPGQTCEWHIKNRQCRSLLHDYDIRIRNPSDSDLRKANIVPTPTWKVIMNFYGRNKTLDDIWRQDMLGACSGVRFVSWDQVVGEDEITQNNILWTTFHLNGDAKNPDNHGSTWIGFYWHANNAKSGFDKRVRGWNRRPDDRALLVPYQKGILIKPDSPQDSANEYTFTFSGPVGLTDEGCVTVLNVTNTDFMYGDEPDATPPPVLEAPDGGLVTDLFTIADTYLAREFDVSGLDLGSGLKPGQWVTVTGTLNDNSDGPFYLATDIQPMDIAGVVGTVSQLDDDTLAFLPDDGEELAFALGDNVQLDEGVAEGGKATLYYHPELVYNDDENGFCDHQQLVLDSISPIVDPDVDVLELDGTIIDADESTLTVFAEGGAQYELDVTDARIEGELAEGNTVHVTYHEAESSLVADEVTSFAPDDDPVDPIVDPVVPDDNDQADDSDK